MEMHSWSFYLDHFYTYETKDNETNLLMTNSQAAYLLQHEKQKVQ